MFLPLSTGGDRLEAMEQQMRLMQEQLQDYRNIESQNKEIQDELRESQVQLRAVKDARNDQFFDRLRQTMESEQPQKKQKREFTPHGDKIVPAAYGQMNTDGLLTLETVDPNVRDKIARNEFVELVALHKVEDAELSRKKQATAEADDSVSKSAIKDRPEFFYLMYKFGMYYLQCYPEKTVAFLEYMAFLTRYGKKYTVSQLVRLDTSCRRHFAQNPSVNWNPSLPHIERFVRDIQVEIEENKGGSTTNGVQVKVQPKAKLQQQKFGWQDHGNKWHTGQGYQQSSGRKRGSASYSSRNKDDICRDFNFRRCTRPKCYWEHCCWECRSYDHNVDRCPRRTQA